MPILNPPNDDLSYENVPNVNYQIAIKQITIKNMSNINLPSFNLSDGFVSHESGNLSKDDQSNVILLIDTKSVIDIQL